MEQPWLIHQQWFKNDRDLQNLEVQTFRRVPLPFDHEVGIHSLLGPRRIGKTTQFKVWMLELLKTKSPESIAYFDAERFETWKELLAHLENHSEKLRHHIRYLFVDEITAAKDWTRALKICVDSGLLDSCCVWITGSNAFDLKNAGERLPGRRGKDIVHRDIELLPLTFFEFWQKLPEFFPNTSLQKAFDLFCLWGGYPLAISDGIASKAGEISKNTMLDLLDVVLGETSKHHRSPRLSAALSERLWIQLGGRSSYHALSKFVDAGSHPIIRQYIEILEGCYSLIQTERLNEKTGRGTLRKEKKIYFLDSTVMASLSSWSQSNDVDPTWAARQFSIPEKQGPWIENVLASELRKRNIEFFYDQPFGTEVDFVYKQAGEWIGVEVKRSLPDFSEVGGLKKFKTKIVAVYNLAKPIEKHGIQFIPIADFALSLKR